MIPITKPFRPPLDEYQQFLQEIWDRNWFTNNGPLVIELEKILNDYLHTDNLVYVTNGTIALQLAIKSLNLKGNIITTPFSYVATTSSIVWEGCTPKFVDIEPNTFNIDPTKIENSIDDNTTGIIATHCFGNPCNIDLIEKIAKEHNLKVIYDGAHAFGTNYKLKSIFSYGDICTTSFHATKLFHSVEGGAVFCKDKVIYEKILKMRNFGHAGPEKFKGVGINGKNSELHAAMGIVNLRHIDKILSKRKKLTQNYDDLIQGLNLTKQEICQYSDYNYAYYPVLFENQEVLLNVVEDLNSNGIFPRRYFYPSLSSLKYVPDSLTPISDDIASRILCLPFYHDLELSDQARVIEIIKKNL
jgi:dTDP-4-amino-4,6-dideoxygalactose transaminase